MVEAGTTLNFIILDACRNNPFMARWPVKTQPGLAPMQAARGSFIAYATAPGAIAVEDRKSTRLNSSHLGISYAVFFLKKNKIAQHDLYRQRAETRGHVGLRRVGLQWRGR